MIQAIYNFFHTIFNNNIILATILISVVPIIEVKGAIPFATSSVIWSSEAINNLSAFGWSVLGCSIIVPIIGALFKLLMLKLKKYSAFQKVGSAIEKFLSKKTKYFDENNSASIKLFSLDYWKRMLLVFIFVTIPLLFTGVWTGTCLAIFLGLDIISSSICVISGNLIAGLLITLILEFIPALNDWLFFIMLAVIAIIVLVKVIKYFINKNKSKQI